MNLYYRLREIELRSFRLHQDIVRLQNSLKDEEEKPLKAKSPKRCVCGHDIKTHSPVGQTCVSKKCNCWEFKSDEEEKP